MNATATTTTVLYVEDDLLIARSVQKLLASEGFDVHHALDLEGAEAATRTFVFDVVLLDLGLGLSSGAETVRLARTFTKLPIVVFTGSNIEPDDKLAVEVVAAGADFYLEKTSALHELRRTLRLAIMRTELEAHFHGPHNICGRIKKMETDGALACHCVRCDKVVFLVSSHEGVLACPHCFQHTLMLWGRVRFDFQPELPPRLSADPGPVE